MINQYYAPAFEKLIKMQEKAANLPPQVPRITLLDKEKASADSLIQSSVTAPPLPIEPPKKESSVT